MEEIKLYIEYTAKGIEIAGIITIIIGTVLAMGKFIFTLQNTASAKEWLQQTVEEY